VEEKLTKIIDQVKNLTVLELSELVKALEKEFGVSASAPMAVAVAAPAAGGGDAEAAVKSSFDVVLTNAGASRIPVIKAIREITGLGLKEAKTMVDEAPQTVKAGVTKDEAEKIKEALAGAGATVELK